MLKNFRIFRENPYPEALAPGPALKSIKRFEIQYVLSIEKKIVKLYDPKR